MLAIFGIAANANRTRAAHRRQGIVTVAAVCGLFVLAAPTLAQQELSFDYWQFNREMIRRGQQAVFMCNGLFVSNRTLGQVFEQELAYLSDPVGTASGGDYVVDTDRMAVAIGRPDGVPVMRAAFREGIGCVVLAPVRPSTI